MTRLIELQQVHAQTRDAYLASVSRYEELVTEDAQVTARLNAVIEVYNLWIKTRTIVSKRRHIKSKTRATGKQ